MTSIQFKCVQPLFLIKLLDIQLHKGVKETTNIILKAVNYYRDEMHLLKQEAHGPHRSPEKTVQINKHI